MAISFPTLSCFALSLLLVACNSNQSAKQSETASAPNQSSTSKPTVEILGTPAGTVMTPEYVAAMGRFAYVWGWPLVNNLNRSMAVAKLPEPGRLGGVLPASPPGYVSMLTETTSTRSSVL